MSFFPRARPSSGAPRKTSPKQWPVHRCIPSGDEDWSGQTICRCGMVETHRTHLVDEEREALASQVDARRLGEGESSVE